MGKSNGISRNYDDVIELYRKHLGISGYTNNDFTPSNMESSKLDLILNFHTINEIFLERTTLLSENDLDNYQIPHPLIGLLTCREFLYFTHYHLIHHFKTIKNMMVIDTKKQLKKNKKCS